MKDEIKEILDKCTPFLFGDEVDKLTDFITNLQEENKELKINKDKALDYIRMHCEIRRNEEKGYDEIGKVEALPIYYILQGSDKNE